MKSKVEPSLSDVSPLTRRMFISAATATAAALGGERDAAHGTQPGQATLSARSRAAYDVRVDAARAEKDAAQPDQVSNGDEQQFANRIGNYGIST
jgi:hypothetical protein